MEKSSKRAHHSHERLFSDEPIKTSSPRSFGFVFAAVFMIIALWPLTGAGELRIWACMVAAILALIALIFPRLLAPANRVWIKFGLILHRITNPVIMAVMFFGVITPIALAMRLGGKKFLQLDLDRSLPSYWIDRNPPGPDPETMINQF